MNQIVARDYQDLMISGSRGAISQPNVRAAIVTGATGCGKTVVFTIIATRAAGFGRRVLILAHRDRLLKQTRDKILASGGDVGVIQAKYTESLYKPIQLASVQSLIRRIRKNPSLYKFDLIIIDEAHLSMARTYREIVDALPNAKVLGFTATPWRLDGKGLGTQAGGFYDAIVNGPQMGYLTERGYLCRAEVYGPQVQIDLSNVGTERGEYIEEEVAEIMDKPSITGNCIEQYKSICPGKRAIAWCVNLKHARHVCDQFNAAGIPAEVLHGDHEEEEREAAIARLVSKQTLVIVFCQLLVEGVDIPEIECVIMLRPTRSLTSYRQTGGRGARPLLTGSPIFADDDDEGRLDFIANSEKPCFYVIDHAGLTYIHGFLDDDIEWSLEGAQKKKKKDKKSEPIEKTAQCPVCYKIFPPAPVCPNGHEQPKRDRKLNEVPGQLQKITKESVEVRKAQQKQRKKEIAAAKTLDEVKSLANKYGYSEKWAEIKFKFKEDARAKYKNRSEALWAQRLESAMFRK